MTQVLLSTAILYGDNIAAQSGAGDTLQLSVTGLALASHLHSGLEFISGITPGIASATKALVVDSNLDIEGIRNLIIDGELTVRGETTIVESNVVQIGDNIIRVNVSGVSTGGLEVAVPDDDLSFDVTVTGSSFRIDGAADPTLNLVKGQTYTFNINTLVILSIYKPIILIVIIQQVRIIVALLIMVLLAVH